MAELKRVKLIILFCFLMMSRVGAAETDEWSILINIPASTLQILRHGKVWRQFPVAVGKKSTPTPIGKFSISIIIENPTWYPTGRSPVPPGIENPLGRFWLGLSINGYGIHGNNKPASIGYPESNGCIRMHNHDVELLVRLVRVGTAVEIIYQTVKVEAVRDKMWLTLYPDYYQRQTQVQEEIKEALHQSALAYPVHWDALRWLIGEERPLIIEIPQEIQLALDGEEYPGTGFLWGDRAFLPTSLTRLWGEERGQPYVELMNFMRTYAGQVYGVFDQQAKTINLHTLRIYFNGQLFPLRGWFQEEPYLPWELVQSIEQELGPPSHGQQLFTTEKEDLWVPMSMLQEGWPLIKLNWDAEKWILEIDL